MLGWNPGDEYIENIYGGRLFQKTFASLKKISGQPRFPFLVAGVAFADIFLFVVPEDLLVIAGAAAQPKHWKRLALITGLGSAAGAALLSWILATGGHALFGSGSAGGWWGNASAYFQRLGPCALLIAASTPIPVQPFVAVATAGGLRPELVFVIVLGGRLLKYTGITQLIKFRRRLKPQGS